MSDQDASCSQTESRRSSQEPPSASASTKGRKCPYCSRQFAKADHYTRHIRSHTKEKPFRCTVCLKAYPRHDTLLRHARTHRAQGQGLARHGRAQSWSSVSYSTQMPLPSPPVRNFESGIRGPLGNPITTRVFLDKNTAQGSGEQPYDSQPTMTDLGETHSGSGILTVTNNAHANLEQAMQGSNLALLADNDTESLAVIDSANWLLEEDFDLSVFDNLNYFQTPEMAGIDVADVLEADETSATPHRLAIAPRRALPHVADLRHLWYTQVPVMASGFEAGSGTETPQDLGENSTEDIDESYRASMANKLRPPFRDEPLPTIEFMNLCIHLFFTRFNVALPLVHGPTFRPTADSALLVLSICSAGTLCLGSELAARTGCMLFERVNKAHLSAPWERYLSRVPNAVRATLKASMIGQTFALLSEHPFHLTTASSYHGTLISVARHARLYNRVPAFALKDHLSPQDLHKAWTTWAQEEEMKRVVLLLHIHDAELVALFHHEPIFRHNAASLPVISSSELFNAPSAAAWATKFREEQRKSSPVHPDFMKPRDSWRDPMLVRYAKISGIGASIAECRYLNCLTSEMISKFETQLIEWYNNFSKFYQETPTADQITSSETPFSLLPLWHYTFMTLNTDVNQLELAIGKEGTDIAPSVRHYVYSWISSPNSKRCLLHALLLQNLMVNTTMGSVMAIHTPRILFAAAVCWYCYMLYQPYTAEDGYDLIGNNVFESLERFPEIRNMSGYSRSSSSTISGGAPLNRQASSALKAILGANAAEMKAATLCVLETTLRRLGTSGISRRFADIIQVLISGDGKDEWNG